MTIFFIGDTHFGHTNILKFEQNRPGDTIEQHDEILIQNWNLKVNENDTVYHLGDVCFGGMGNLEKIGRLNGTKHLILGNHDTLPLSAYAEYFKEIHAYAILKTKEILSHIPLHISQAGRWKRNIHGHRHSHNLSEPFYFNASCENINYTPIAYEEIYG